MTRVADDGGLLHEQQGWPMHTFLRSPGDPLHRTIESLKDYDQDPFLYALKMYGSTVVRDAAKPVPYLDALREEVEVTMREAPERGIRFRTAATSVAPAIASVTKSRHVFTSTWA